VPRFVILEHDWNGIHWDFMLEAGGSLRTWAIGEPIVRGTLLPARALPDHRVAYLDYEGPVSGGRGNVRAIARGTYEVLAWAPDRVAVRLAGTDFGGEVELRRVDSGGIDAGWTFLLGNVI
jgi:hypothetical protein